MQASVIAYSNPTHQHAKTVFKYIRLSIVPFIEKQPITLLVKLNITWINGSTRIEPIFHLVSNVQKIALIC